MIALSASLPLRVGADRSSKLEKLHLPRSIAAAGIVFAGMSVLGACRRSRTIYISLAKSCPLNGCDMLIDFQALVLRFSWREVEDHA